MDKRHVHMDYIVMQSWMAYITTNPIMGVVILGMFWHSESENNKIYPMWDMFYQWPKCFRNFKI